MSEYKFRYQKDGHDICLIETEKNIIPIIKEYRGKYKGFGYGYNEPNLKSEEFAYEKEYNYKDIKTFEDTKPSETFSYFYAYKGDEQIFPSNDGPNASITYMNGDIRRVLGDILYILYCYNGENSQSRNGSISSITYMDATYTDISDVQLTLEKKVIFKALKNGKNVKICLPISLEGIESRLSPQSTQKLYCLYDQNTKTNLHLYDTKTIYNNCKERFEIDRFWGTHNGYKGIFYYFHDEIIPQYAVTEEAGKYMCKISDIKRSFFDNKLKEISYNENNEQYIYEFFQNFLETPIDEAEAETIIKNFEKEFQNIIWNQIIYENQLDVKYESETFHGKKKEGSRNIYLFNIEDTTYCCLAH